MGHRLLRLGLLVLLAGGAARAGTISYSAMQPSTLTDWSSNATFSLFDPSLGTLTGVQIDLLGDVNGSIQYENQGPSPATVTGTLSADLALQWPTHTPLLSVSPLQSVTDTLAPFDGSTDFGGTSGMTYSNLFGSLSNSWSSSDPLVLSQFTGLGTIDLPWTATATTGATGDTGNLLLHTVTYAGGTATVTYSYAVPEPGTLAILGCGLVPLLRRRRAR